MELWQSLYHLLFNAATDALRALDRGDTEAASALLIRAQRQAEALYLRETE